MAVDLIMCISRRDAPPSSDLEMLLGLRGSSKTEGERGEFQRGFRHAFHLSSPCVVVAPMEKRRMGLGTPVFRLMLKWRPLMIAVSGSGLEVV